METTKNKPIDFQYQPINDDVIRDLNKQSAIYKIKPSDKIIPLNSYYQAGRKGTKKIMFTREAVLLRLEKIAEQLMPNYGLVLFDTYRSIETQTELFNESCHEIKKQHPDWNQKMIEEAAKEFVSHPTDPTHFEIPLHNSGGAVDLAIYDMCTQKTLDFGSEFDEFTDRSHTDFFEKPFDSNIGINEEQWETYRSHRRMLYHLMINAGFINYPNEWWHYDLGDCLWAKTLNTKWVFDSMENQLPIDNEI